VEPSYLEVAGAFQRALRQRNAALRLGDRVMVRQWHRPLSVAADRLDRLRAHYAADMLGRAAELLLKWGVDFTIRYRYRRGWPPNQTLEQRLAARLDQDLKLGYTASGPQRADLEFSGDCGLADKTLSRGQQKLLVMALNLATMDQIIGRRKTSPVLLIDDLAAELDSVNRARLLDELQARGAQVFLTMIEKTALRAPRSAPVFHVEHGRLRD
jgi:DNA replication and repair protein RecF